MKNKSNINPMELSKVSQNEKGGVSLWTSDSEEWKPLHFDIDVTVVLESSFKKSSPDLTTDQKRRISIFDTPVTSDLMTKVIG